jgi:hypothetical protein
MRTEQFKRANEIADRVKQLSEKRDKLKSINEQGVHQIEIKTYDAGHIYFKLDNNLNERNAIEHQPASIDVLLRAFIQTSMNAYQREIDALEKEFNEL